MYAVWVCTCVAPASTHPNATTLSQDTEDSDEDDEDEDEEDEAVGSRAGSTIRPINTFLGENSFSGARACCSWACSSPRPCRLISLPPPNLQGLTCQGQRACLQPRAHRCGRVYVSGAHRAKNRQLPHFFTLFPQVDLWDATRSDPLHSFKVHTHCVHESTQRTFRTSTSISHQWGADSVYTVKFCPVEPHILASTASDRNVVLYDVR